MLCRVEVISTVSGGSIVGALYYLHVKNLLEDKPDETITDADYIEVVRQVERDYREGAATNIRGSAWANPVANFHMAKPTYSRTDRAGELYERRFYARAWRDRPKPGGRIAMRDLLISPKGHGGAFDPDSDNATRRARGADPAARGDDPEHRAQLALRSNVRGRAASSIRQRRHGAR